MKHTLEPWKFEPDKHSILPGRYLILRQDGDPIAQIYSQPNDQAYVFARLIASAPSMDIKIGELRKSIDTLVSIKLAQEIEIGRLKKINADLLEACKAAFSVFETQCKTEKICPNNAVHLKLYDAISMAEKEV